MAGLFDTSSWFGGGSNDNQVTQTSTTSTPAFFDDFSRRSFNALDNLSQSAYQPYDQGPRIAGFSDLQKDVINKFQSSTGGPAYTQGSAWAGLQGLNSRSQAANQDMAALAFRNPDGSFTDAMGNPIKTGQIPNETPPWAGLPPSKNGAPSMSDPNAPRQSLTQISPTTGGLMIGHDGLNYMAVRDMFDQLGANNAAGKMDPGFDVMGAQLGYINQGNLSDLQYFASKMNPNGPNAGALRDRIAQLQTEANTPNQWSGDLGAKLFGGAVSSDPGSSTDMSADQAGYINGLGGQGLAELIARPELKGMALGNIGNAIQAKYGAGSGTAMDALRQLATTIQNTPGADVQGMQRSAVNSMSAGDIADLLRAPEAANYGSGLRNILSTRLNELAAANVDTPMGSAIDMAGNFAPVSANQIAPTGTLTADQITPGSIAKTDLSSYMNPYLSSVVDPTMKEIQRQADIANLGIKANATASGSFGDARHGVAEAELQGRALDLKQQMMAQLMTSGYDRATSLAGQDVATNLQGQAANQAANLNAGQFNLGQSLAAQQANQAASLNAGQFNQTGNLNAANLLGNLAGQQQNMDLTNMQSLWDIGSQQQGMDQQNFDLMYQDWLRQQQYPYQQLDRRLAAIQGRPMSTTQTTTSPGANTTAGDLGSIAAIIGALGKYGPTSIN